MTITPFKLSPEREQALKDMAPDLTALQQEINKAARAGIDVTELAQKLAKTKSLREGLLREYGSGT